MSGQFIGFEDEEIAMELHGETYQCIAAFSEMEKPIVG